jgi:endonuclease/exonuclease/phosphatase family metal-dependent hydrolase
MAEQSQPGLRVATWNVHSCIGRSRTFDPHLTAAVAKTIGADILALQEVDSRPHVSADLDTFDFLRRRLGGHAVRAATIEEGEGACYGHMLVSRWPIRRYEVHDASVPGTEPRKVIEVEVDTPAGSWGIAAVHFGLNRRERRIQLHFIRDMLDRVTYEPVLVMGDFNVPTRGGLSKRLPANVKAFSLMTGHPTKARSLPKSIREDLPEDAPANIYPKHLPADAVEEIWSTFREALRPLDSAGKLGVVMFQFPEWFMPGRKSREEIVAARDRLNEYEIAVEFRQSRWFEDER